MSCHIVRLVSRHRALRVVLCAAAVLLSAAGLARAQITLSVISTWVDPRFWSTSHDLRIDLLHTDPVERAGGLRDKEFTPTIDGWFDRI